jgi:hypothetical protein
MVLTKRVALSDCEKLRSSGNPDATTEATDATTRAVFHVPWRIFRRYLRVVIR